jgi:predicted  nucleic acid-binding Zn-ribbon protein
VRIDATLEELRALLQLAEVDARMEELTPDAYRSRREASRRRVGPRLLERYEELLEAGRSPALVAMERGNCTGCHIRLPTLVEYRVRCSPAIHSCPHCRRMVYAKELLATESGGATSRKAPPGRARKAGAHT